MTPAIFDIVIKEANLGKIRKSKQVKQKNLKVLNRSQFIEFVVLLGRDIF